MDEASEKNRSICNFNKFCVLFIHIYLNAHISGWYLLYIYIYIYEYIYIYIYIHIYIIYICISHKGNNMKVKYNIIYYNII